MLKHDMPKKSIEVENVCDLDLSPLELVEVPWGNRLLRFRNALSLTPSLNESSQLLVLSEPDLGIEVFASTREQLWMELHEQVVMLWQEYAREEPPKLSTAARKLRTRLRGAIEEL